MKNCDVNMALTYPQFGSIRGTHIFKFSSVGEGAPALGKASAKKGRKVRAGSGKGRCINYVFFARVWRGDGAGGLREGREEGGGRRRVSRVLRWRSFSSARPGSCGRGTGSEILAPPVLARGVLPSTHGHPTSLGTTL